MAYIPPHKRHSKDAETPTPYPTPVPASLSPRFQQSLTLSSPHHHHRRRGDLSSSSSSQQGGGKMAYAAHCVSRWWLVGGGSVPESLRLEPFPREIVERRSGAKPLVVVAAAAADDGGKGGEEEERPWVGIARRAEQDLVASARSAREELDAVDGNAKLSFVARVGKVLFHGDPSTCLNSIQKAAIAEEGFKNQVHKSFYTNVPNEFMKNVEQLLVTSIGFDFESEREHYHVKVFDKCQPDSTISCKCTVGKDGGLELYKIELNQVRHMVVDISCLHKDLDMRLMLVTKKLLKNLDDEVESGINQLISSAIIDSEVKGGLRWPFGKESVAERFSVVGVWLARYKAYRSKTMRLKLRHADRFDHKTSTGEVANEVTLKLSAISELLREGNLEETPVREMLEATVKLVWEKFLSYNISPLPSCLHDPSVVPISSLSPLS